VLRDEAKVLNERDGEIPLAWYTSKLREMGYKLRKYYRERIGHHPDALEMARQEKECRD
jgi:hypothetical protein